MIVIGHRNRTKAKVLIALFLKNIKNRDKEGLDFLSLSILARVKKDTVRALAGRWAKWHYLKRENKIKNGRSISVYTIAQKGIDALSSLPAEQIKELIQEMRGS